MKITSRTLAKLERGYSIALLPSTGERLPSFLAGSEEEDRLLFFEAPDFQPKVIASSPGGYISICPLVRDGRRYVIATTEFKPGFNAAPAAIRLFPLDGPENPPSTLIAELPYTHRIALQAHAGRLFLLASTLCAAKAHKEDWTQPGGIHLAEVPAGDLGRPWPMRQIVRGMNKNHGMDFARLGRALRPGYLLSCMEGLSFMPLPADPAGDWPVEPIMPDEHSDAFAFDWNGDGEPEIFAISPFHGNVLTLLQREGAGWKRTVIHDDLALGHIVWAGNLLGGPALLAGSRRERRELRLYRPGPGGTVDPKYELIDTGIGPSQMNVVVHDARSATLYVAAHGQNEVRLYHLEA
jgi:hypothetical protein